MYRNVSSGKRGFTMVELLVVIAIITILLGVVMASISEVRKSSRDKKRISDLAQIELALRLYVESRYSQDGGRIDCLIGMKIDGNTNVVSLNPSGNSTSCVDGSKILTFIQSQLGTIPADPLSNPLSPSNDYYYYFDAQHSCTDASGNVGKIPILFAVNLEKGASNKDILCPGGNGGQGGFSNTQQFGGTFTTGNTQPYARHIKFVYY